MNEPRSRAAFIGDKGAWPRCVRYSPGALTWLIRSRISAGTMWAVRGVCVLLCLGVVIGYPSRGSKARDFIDEDELRTMLTRLVRTRDVDRLLHQNEQRENSGEGSGETIVVEFPGEVKEGSGEGSGETGGAFEGFPGDLKYYGGYGYGLGGYRPHGYSGPVEGSGEEEGSGFIGAVKEGGEEGSGDEQEDEPVQQCPDGDFISASWRCDGRTDCDDGSDEQGCEELCEGLGYPGDRDCRCANCKADRPSLNCACPPSQCKDILENKCDQLTILTVPPFDMANAAVRHGVPNSGRVVGGAMRADMVFITDGSASIGTFNFEEIKKFMRQMVDGLTVSSTSFRVGAMQFAYSNREEFGLEDNYDNAGVDAAICAIPYMDGPGTYTGEAILFAKDYMFAPIRPEIRHVGIVITDGKTSIGAMDVGTASGSAQSAGIVLYAIGIGLMNDAAYNAQLQAIAGTSGKVFHVGDFSALSGIISALLADIFALPPPALRKYSNFCAVVLFLRF
ncbi:MATN2 [Branchiostoma lanceolatum]|uniref:MATN2 protein n=1 Tax=Branchiostoma lanceolatum TaxID=7740 RepID=A0A8J9ZCF5_BRALA|nr:MATN2 [Branchiostoma lanceolatum]